MKPEFRVTHAIETIGRVIYFHFLVDEEHHAEAVAILEPSIGLLTIVTNGQSCSHSWVDPDQWGAQTFEEFICSRPANWLTAKLLGGDATEIDFNRTAESLIKACPSATEEIKAFMRTLQLYGIKASQMQNDDTDTIQEELGDPLYDWIFYKPTDIASYLMSAVIPALQNRLAPPQIVTNQTNLHLS